MNDMKRIVMTLLLCCFVAGINAQDLLPQTRAERKEMIKERREAQKNDKALEKQIKKQVKTNTKALKKQGWTVQPGVDPIDMQLQNYYKQKYAMIGEFPAYIMGEATGRGANFTGARKAAQTTAKVDICDQLEAEVAELTEQSVSNKEINLREAESITSTLASSKILVQQKLGRTQTMLEIYRVKDGMTEVRMILSYDGNTAKSDLMKAFEAASKDQQERLMKILGK